MAKDKIVKPFVAITKDKYTIDTIEQLIATKSLKKGDIVRLNGYYDAGDGANHIRKIEESDDGSGVQLSNGLWANIVHNGEVSSRWLGLKCDGISEESDSLQIIVNKMISGVFSFSLDFENNTTFIGKSIEFNPNSSIKIKNGTFLGKGNYPLFLIIDEYHHSWYLENLIFKYGKGTVDENSTKAIGIAFKSTKNINGGFYYSKLKSIRFENCYGGFGLLDYVNGGFTYTLWGLNFDDINFSGIYGFAFRLYPESVAGNPLTVMRNIVINNNNFPEEGQYFKNKEPLIKFLSEIDIDGLNVENMSNAILYTPDSLKTKISNVHIEHHTKDSYLFYINGKSHSFDSMSIDFRTIENLDLGIFHTDSSNNFIDINSSTVSAGGSISQKYELELVTGGTVGGGSTININGVVSLDNSKINLKFLEDFYYTDSGKYSISCINGLLKPKSKELATSDFVPDNIKNSFMQLGYHNGLYGDRLVFLTRDKLGNKMLKTIHGNYDVFDEVYLLDKFSEGEMLYRNTVKNDGEYACIITSRSGTKKAERLYLPNPISQLDTPYYTTKMQQEGVFEDFIMYMDEKVEYNLKQKQQNNSGFMMLSFVEEPKPSKKLSEFAEKYLG